MSMFFQSGFAGRANQLGAPPIFGVPLPTYGGGTPSILTTNPSSSPTYGGGQTTVQIVPVNSGNQNSNSGNGNFSQYFNTISSLVSQIVSGWSKNPTSQVVAGGGIMPIQNQQQQQSQYVPPNPNAAAAISPQGNLFDGLFSTITNNPLTVLAIGFGAYFLFKSPPGRR